MPDDKTITPIPPPVKATDDTRGIQESPEFPPVSSDRKWLIARVLPNTEKTSRDKLLKLGYEVFLASQMETRFWKNGNRVKKKVVESVIITQYLFVHVTLRERLELIALPFIKAFLKDSASTDGTGFAIVPDEEMQALISILSQNDEPVNFISTGFKVGEKVKVSFGSYEYKAIIIKIRNDSKAYIGVRVRELGCAYLRMPPHTVSHLESS